MKLFLSILFSCFLCLLSTLAATTHVYASDVYGIRTGQTASGARIVFDLSAPVDYRAFLLAQPARLVVDLTAQNWHVAKNSFQRNSIITGYRTGNVDNGLIRVVFDLKHPAIIQKTGLLPKTATAKDRLVIDLERVSAQLFQARLSDVFGDPDIRQEKSAAQHKNPALSGYAEMRNESVAAIGLPTAIPTRKPDLRTSPRQKIYTIVVDAGHGGQDPGAIASNGIREKDITLNAAQALRRALEETGRYRVVMTRQKDYYIRLRERVAIARKNNADLFISLHADKIDRKNVRGASIYTLSEKASDDETERLAETENNAGIVAGVDLSEESEDVANILLDLAMREKVNESSLLAQYIQSGMRKENIKLLPNSHRSAGFAVLKAPDVPAVLIEIGFLSNAEEARLISSKAFQSRISDAIVGGVDGFFRKMESLQKL